MAKIAKTFRLSEQAVKNLELVVSLTGSSDTAIVEMALAHFAGVMQCQVVQEKANQVSGYPPDPWEQEGALVPPDPWEQEGALVEMARNLSSAKGDKQRHRHKSSRA